MRVIDHEPQTWFLLEEDESLYVDGNYGHSFIGYTYPIQLDDAETEAYRTEGRAAIHRMVDRIQHTAPLLAASRSVYKGRKVDEKTDSRMRDAIRRWRESEHGPPDDEPLAPEA